MADFSNIENQIDNAITTNGVGAITGAILNAILKGMLSAVDAEKEDTLTFDLTPTEDSVKPVTSGGVYDALAAAAQDVATALANYYTKTEADTLMAAKADDSAVVHNTGDENIYGIKSFQKNVMMYGSGNYANKMLVSKLTMASNGGGIDANGKPVTDLPTPSAGSDAATKKYVDDGLATKQDTIADLAAIRSGAAAGATAVQPATMQAEIGNVAFQTGEQVNATKIVNDLTTGGTTDVLSAEQGKVIDNELFNYESINLDTSSPYYQDVLNDAAINRTSGLIYHNSYTSAYKILLFKVPAGKYTTKLISSNTTHIYVGTIASANDFIVGGSVSSIIDDRSTVGQDVVLEYESETYLVLLARTDTGSNINTYASITEINVTSKIETLQNEVDSIIPMVEEIPQLKDKVDNLSEEVLTNKYINIDRTSPYFVERLTNAYILGSGVIRRNPYTGSYLIDLFRLPAGNYRFAKVGNHASSSQPILVAKIASTEDFVVDGYVITPAIINGGDEEGKQVELTFEEETLVVLVNRPDFSYYYYCTADKVNVVSTIPSQVEESVEQAFSNNLDIVIPDTVYAIVGTELNIWNDTVSLSIDKGLHSPMNYQIRWNCNKGLITDRCFRFTPTANDVGNVSCTCYIYDITGKLVSSKTFTIKVLANNALNSAKNIVYFGDSLGGSAATALYDNFHDANRFGGIIPNMLGTKGSTKHYEAVGGYKWSSYATAGSVGYRISVSGVSSMSVGAVYSDGSHNFEIYEVNITDGEGNCLLGTYWNNPGTLIMPSGTLTKVSGSGDASVPYTGAFQESVNPLWNDTNQELDIAQYKQMLVDLGQLSSTSDKIDAVSFQFGINDNGLANDLTTLHTYISDLYNLFVGDNADCKVIIGLTTSSGNDVNGSGANYGASNNWKGYLENTYKIRKYYLTLLSEFPNLRIATPNLYLDRYYGYAFSTRQISDRYTTTEQYHNNYVHPATSGYNQMADAYLAAYVGVLTE